MTLTLIDRAREFAHAAHDSIGQKRKYSGEPYWVHTDEVAELVASVGGNPRMIAAAHLHDVLEDVATFRAPESHPFGFDAIQVNFGREVAILVLHLTDLFTHENHPKLNRAFRKHLERARLSMVPPEAQTIKVADLISNTKSIVKEDPDFSVVYLKEKAALLHLLKYAHPDLVKMAQEQLK